MNVQSRLPVAVLVLAFAVAHPPGPVAGAQVFRAGVDGVAVDVLVTRDGRPVPGLTAGDFELRDDGRLQKVESIAIQDVPVTLLLVLDTSESVAGRPLDHLKDAAHAAAAALGPEDTVGLITFSHRVQMRATPAAPRGAIDAALASLEADGATPLYDAVFAAIALRERSPGRTIVLVFSDGDDTVSWLDPRDVLESAQRSDVVVYGVSLQRSLDVHDLADRKRQTLERQWFHREPQLYGRYFLPLVTEHTGGTLVAAESSRIREVFVALVREFRSRYVLTYQPRGVAADGWHTIDVRLKGRHADVRARRGYLR